MKINTYTRIILILTPTFLCLCIIGYFLYNLYVLKAKQRVLDSNRIVKLNVNDYLTSTDTRFYEPKPDSISTVSAAWLTSPVTNIMNSDALNALQEYTVQTPPATYRIVALGNSFTYGIFVPTNENYPEKLHALLNSGYTCPAYTNYEVINLGVAGYDVRLAAQRYKLRGKKYSPTLILWYVMPDDFDLDKFQTIQDYDVTLKQEQEKNYTDRFWVADQYRPVTAYKKARVLYRQTHSKDQTIAMQYSHVVEVGRIHTGPMVLITDNQSSDDFIALLRKFAASRKDTYVLVLPDYGRFPDMHPTADGYSFISKSIYAFITQNAIIRCAR